VRTGGSYRIGARAGGVLYVFNFYRMQEKNDGEQNKQEGLSWSAPQKQSQNQQQQYHPFVPAKPVATPPASNNNTARYAGMVVVGVIAGVVIAWGYSAWRTPDSTANNTNATSTVSITGTPTGGDNFGVDVGTAALGSNTSLSIASPQAAGRSVVVTKAMVSAPTWVVIYENSNGKPGNALGAALFFPGTTSGTVELLRATVAGKTYLAAEQVDNGDRKFSLKDDQLVMVGGAIQWVTFETK